MSDSRRMARDSLKTNSKPTGKSNGGRGGARKGAGRKKGPERKTVVRRTIAERALETGLTPLDYMLGLLRDGEIDTNVRFEAAKAAAPYVHPRLAAVEHTGKGGGPIRQDMAWTVELVRAR